MLLDFDWLLLPLVGCNITIFLLPIAQYIWLLQIYRYVRKHPGELSGTLTVSYRYSLQSTATQILHVAGLPVLLICLFDPQNSFAFGCLLGIFTYYLKLVFLCRRAPHKQV